MIDKYSMKEKRTPCRTNVTNVQFPLKSRVRHQ